MIKHVGMIARKVQHVVRAKARTLPIGTKQKVNY